MLKKQAAFSPTLFEMAIPAPPREAPPPPRPNLDACPRCGGKSQRSLRPEEHGGRTHYCVCDCREGEDMFYFTPDPKAVSTTVVATVPGPEAFDDPEKDESPCPLCGRPCSRSKRAAEYGGKT